MFKAIELRILSWVLTKTLKKKPEGNSIPLSGEEAKKNDCYIVRIKHKDIPEEKEALLDGFDKVTKTLKVRALDSTDTFSIETSLPLEGARISLIKHYYGFFDLYYISLWQYLLEGVTCWDVIKVNVLYKFKQWLYNKRKLILKSRMDTLEAIVKAAVEHEAYNSKEWGAKWQKYEFSYMEVGKILFGSHAWYAHPKGKETRARISLHLESLKESGDINCAGTLRYALNAKSMETLTAYEISKRRHRDMFWLTIVLAVAALDQAGVLPISEIIIWFIELIVSIYYWFLGWFVDTGYRLCGLICG